MMHRKALTVMELLVIVTVIVILISLLAVALLSAREATRKVTCSSNLRDLGLALQNYEAAFRCMPLSGYGWSAHSRLMPYLGEEQRYAKIQFGVSYEDAINEPHVAVPRLLICPSDPETTSSENRWAANYLGIAGGGVAPAAERSGLLISYDRRGDVVRFSSVADGLSNTLAFTEAMAYMGRRVEGSIIRKGIIYKTSRRFALPEELSPFREECFNSELGNTARLGLGSYWPDPSIGVTRICCIYPKQPRNCLNGRSFSSAMLAPSSAHSQLLLCVFADAHVQSLSDDISEEVWQALATRNGREQIAMPVD